MIYRKPVTAHTLQTINPEVTMCVSVSTVSLQTRCTHTLRNPGRFRELVYEGHGSLRQAGACALIFTLLEKVVQDGGRHKQLIWPSLALRLGGKTWMSAKTPAPKVTESETKRTPAPRRWRKARRVRCLQKQLALTKKFPTTSMIHVDLVILHRNKNSKHDLKTRMYYFSLSLFTLWWCQVTKSQV